MILDEDDVLRIALSKQDKWISLAIQDSKHLKAHFYGDGSTELLSKISGLESKAQYKLREKHSISNKHIVENLLRPTDSIWNAKGGAITFEAKTDVLTENIKNYVNNAGHGLPIKQYLKNIWFDFFVTDPNGLMFLEIDEKDNIRLTQKQIGSIKNMEVTGVKPEYVCFEPEKIKIPEKFGYHRTELKALWVVDDAFYYRVSINNGKAKIIDKKVNSFGYVPARQNSPIYDTNRKIKISPIWGQIQLLDKYLVNNSVKEIYQFLHGYPIFWTYVNGEKCLNCKGTGQKDGCTCTSCKGAGSVVKKDVSDGLWLKPPKDTDTPTLAPNVAGYVQPDLETWKEQRTELDWAYNIIYFSHWGTTTEKADNETATGRFIDVQPVHNKLNTYIDIVENTHSFAINTIGDYVAGKSYEGASVNYGRRLLIETPDQIFKKYTEAKEKKAPVLSLDNLLVLYYESEYQNNKMMLDYYLKLIRIEPFVHESVSDVVSNETISLADKQAKSYFSDWVKTVMIVEVIDKTIDKLKKELYSYSQNKISDGI